MNRALVHAHITAQAHLRHITEQAVKRSWVSLPGYDEGDVNPFVNAVTPLIHGAQRHSIALTNAYLARATRQKPIGVDQAKILTNTRNGVGPQEVYRRPFVTVWSALKAGTQWQDAVNAGLARATGSAAMDVQLAMRDTARAVGDASDSIMGFQRVADGDACEFCQEVDGAQFRTDDPMPLHNNCGCSVEPIEYTRTSFKPSTPPPTVAVADHGELGPLLVAPDQHFSQL